MSRNVGYISPLQPPRPRVRFGDNGTEILGILGILSADSDLMASLDRDCFGLDHILSELTEME